MYFSCFLSHQIIKTINAAKYVKFLIRMTRSLQHILFKFVHNPVI